jgi:hypothetical protein
MKKAQPVCTETVDQGISCGAIPIEHVGVVSDIGYSRIEGPMGHGIF